MQSYLGPPAVTISVGKQICLNKDCNAPFNMTKTDNHAQHKMDVVYIQDIVIRLHSKNQKIKEELGEIQRNLLKRIESNDNAIEALRREDQTQILSHLKNLRQQSESLDPQLIERNNLDFYDDLFFSSRQQRKFEKLIEPSEKEIKDLFQKLIQDDNNVFTQCQVQCPHHNAERVNAFNLQKNVPKNQRLLCQQDRLDVAQNFQVCEQQLKRYCEQEKLFVKLYKMKDFIFSLRFQVDCITNKILTQIQNAISIHQDFFLQNQKNFNDLYQLIEPIPKETYENIAELLSKIGQQLPFNDTFKTTIGQFDRILNIFEQSIIDTQNNFGDFLNKLTPKIIKITVEVVFKKNTQVYHLEVQPEGKLQDLFDFIKTEGQIAQTINQTVIKINNRVFNQSEQSPHTYVLKHEQYIEFYVDQ